MRLRLGIAEATLQILLPRVLILLAAHCAWYSSFATLVGRRKRGVRCPPAALPCAAAWRHLPILLPASCRLFAAPSSHNIEHV